MSFQINTGSQRYTVDEQAAIHKLTQMFPGKKALFEWFTVHRKYNFTTLTCACFSI